MAQNFTAEMPMSYGMYYSMPTTWNFTNGSSFAVTAFPMPGANENQIIANKLGRNGFQRIQQFRDYQPGWDFGCGQAMSEIGFIVLCQFLERLELPGGMRPSVFLTQAGHLEVAWEQTDGGKVQAEFGPKGIEFYRENTGAEGILGLTEAPRAAEILTG